MKNKLLFALTSFCVLFLAALCVVIINRIKSCSNPDVDPVHINQLAELENFEYGEYFSSLCEFGYKTDVKRSRECFTATTDYYVTDLMSEKGVTYSAEEFLTEVSRGIGFKLHFKGGKRIKTIELDYKALSGHKYVSPIASNYSSVPADGDYLGEKTVTVKTQLPFKWADNPHFVYNFNENNNFRNPKPLSDVIEFRFYTGSWDTDKNYKINISNLRITFVQ